MFPDRSLIALTLAVKRSMASWPEPRFGRPATYATLSLAVSDSVSRNSVPEDLLESIDLAEFLD